MNNDLPIKRNMLNIDFNKKPIELIINKDIEFDKINDIFPKTYNIEKIRITDVGLYSITKKNEAYFITSIISKSFMNSDYTITDSTAGIGGNTMSFQMCDNILKVNSVELDELHFNILKNNINLYRDSDKVNLINANYLDICKKIEQDVIFFDLPWGGRDYKKNEQVSLGLENSNGKHVNIITIINDMKNFAKIQVLKVPTNFNFNDFFKEINYNKIKIHKIFNKYTKKIIYFILILFGN